MAWNKCLGVSGAWEMQEGQGFRISLSFHEEVVGQLPASAHSFTD